MRKIIEFFGFGGSDNASAGGNKKINLWLVGLAVIGVLLLVASAMDWPASSRQETPNEQDTQKQTQELLKGNMSREEEDLSRKLCEMLKKIEGAGAVEVSVRLSDTTQSEYAVNTTTGKKTTQEQDQSGGTRVTTEDSSSNQLVMNRKGQEEQPVVEREAAPRIAGILVVAEGAGNPLIKSRLFNAAKVAMGVEPQNILVVPRERGE